MNDYLVEHIINVGTIYICIDSRREYIDNLHRNFNLLSEIFEDNTEFHAFLNRLKKIITRFDMSGDDYSHMTVLVKDENYDIYDLGHFFDSFLNESNIFEIVLILFKNNLNDYIDEINEYLSIRNSDEKTISFSKTKDDCDICYNSCKYINIENNNSSCFRCVSKCCTTCFNRILNKSTFKCPSCRLINKIKTKNI